MSLNPVFISCEWLNDYLWHSTNFSVQQHTGKRRCLCLCNALQWLSLNQWWDAQDESFSIIIPDDLHSLIKYWSLVIQSFLNNLCSVFLSDTMLVWKCPVPALPMLPQRKQLHHHSADLRLLLTAWRQRGLRDADTRHGRAAEEGQVIYC